MLRGQSQKNMRRWVEKREVESKVVRGTDHPTRNLGGGTGHRHAPRMPTSKMVCTLYTCHCHSAYGASQRRSGLICRRCAASDVRPQVNPFRSWQ